LPSTTTIEPGVLASAPATSSPEVTSQTAESNAPIGATTLGIYIGVPLILVVMAIALFVAKKVFAPKTPELVADVEDGNRGASSEVPPVPPLPILLPAHHVQAAPSQDPMAAPAPMMLYDDGPQPIQNFPNLYKMPSALVQESPMHSYHRDSYAGTWTASILVDYTNTPTLSSRMSYVPPALREPIIPRESIPLSERGISNTFANTSNPSQKAMVEETPAARQVSKRGHVDDSTVDTPDSMTTTPV
jgi:hypothetical protein